MVFAFTHLLIFIISVVVVSFEQSAYVVTKGSAFNIRLTADHPSANVQYSVNALHIDGGGRGEIRERK